MSFHQQESTYSKKSMTVTQGPITDHGKTKESSNQWADVHNKVTGDLKKEKIREINIFSNNAQQFESLLRMDRLEKKRFVFDQIDQIIQEEVDRSAAIPEKLKNDIKVWAKNQDFPAFVETIILKRERQQEERQERIEMNNRYNIGKNRETEI